MPRNGMTLTEVGMVTVLAAMATLLVGSWFAHTASGGGDLPDEYEVRELLRVNEFKEERRALIAFGERAFPVYLRILADADARHDEVGRIFNVVSNVEADRSGFLEYAVAKLADPQFLVRLPAVHLLGQIGSERDAAPVVALLSDERPEASYAAAKTLVVIGDQRALVAFDVWLLTGNHRENGDLRQHVAKCRDKLKQRLEKAKKPSK